MSRFVLHANATNRATILANAISFLHQLPSDKSWEVSIEKHTKARSSPQCRYLNGCVYKTLGDALGFERDDISEFLCGERWGWYDKELPGGRTEKKPIRTTTVNANGQRSVLSKAEFSDYVEFCMRYAAQHGVYIPSPEQEFDE